MSTWIDDYYADVDAMRLEPYVERHSDDAAVIFGNNPPAVGKEAIRAAIGGFWSMIGGLRRAAQPLVRQRRRHRGAGGRHPLHDQGWRGGRGALRLYPRPGRRRQGHLLRVHIDLAPLFERIGAEQADRPEAVTA